MAKVQIKSEKLTPFGGIFSIMEQFDSMLSPIIDQTLGQRCRSIIGYQYSEIFFWLATPEMAIERVAKRVSEGGHNIPTPTIIRRYWLGLQNFFNIFAPIVDGWMFFNNVGSTILLATEESVINKELFTKIRESCQNKKKEI